MNRAAWDAAWLADAHTCSRTLWRGVEAQHVVATMKLVDSLQEQDVLETLLEGSKPPLDPRLRLGHYLLVTPFRYRSPHPSRFRRPFEAGLWYGAEARETACTELAYWRWRFLTDSDGLASREIVVELTFFQAVASGREVDLSSTPWDDLRELWRHPTDYSACQDLAAACRESGDIGWIRYWSARHVEGHCAAVLLPECLSLPQPHRLETWVFKVTAQRVLMVHDQDRLELNFPLPAIGATPFD